MFVFVSDKEKGDDKKEKMERKGNQESVKIRTNLLLLFTPFPVTVLPFPVALSSLLFGSVWEASDL